MPKKSKTKSTSRKVKAKPSVGSAYRNRTDFRKHIQPFVETKAFQSGNVGVTNYLSTSATAVVILTK